MTQKNGSTHGSAGGTGKSDTSGGDRTNPGGGRDEGSSLPPSRARKAEVADALNGSSTQ
jgi:hypothetical protein